MPKERIYDQAELYDVQVGWSNDGTSDVQIGIETFDGVPLVAKLGAGGDDAQGLAQFTGVWASLDRVGVNRLIRTLRKARDASFGRDE